ncbi:MAG TPA: ABC transporter permease, partial [Micromonospora sp.]
MSRPRQVVDQGPTPEPVRRIDAARALWRFPVSAPFLGRRLLGAVVAIWGAVSVVFVILLGTGNPAQAMAAEDATAEEVAALAQAYGFDRPLWVQYLLFLRSAVSLDFPKSLYTDVPAFSMVLERLPATLLLSGMALLIGTTVGLTAGYLAAGGGALWRVLPVRVLLAVQSTPSFFLGLVLILVFGISLRWLPTSGSGTWGHLVLPAATLSAYVAPNIARLFWTTLREAATEDHVLTAVAKGVSARRVRLSHVALNAMGPVTALIGLQAGALLGGAIVTEAVFAWPGVGNLLVRSVSTRDYPVVLATVVFICLAFVLA